MSHEDWIKILLDPGWLQKAYRDYQIGLDHCEADKSISLGKENPQLFHTYTDLLSPKDLEVVRSWLVSQQLTHKLIVWSDVDLSNHPDLKPLLDIKFLHGEHPIETRIWDPVEEAKGTPLEDFSHLKANDDRHWLSSDLMRLLVGWKYGGVFTDMDVFYLKNMNSLLGLEFMYQWGNKTNFSYEGCCASVMRLEKGSDLATHLLETLKSQNPQQRSTCWGKDLFAQAYRSRPWLILPGSFFNTEWLMSEDMNHPPEGPGREIEKGWFSRTPASDCLFLEAYTWHWHNTTHRNDPIEPGSKFDQLQKITTAGLRMRFEDDGS